jgi:hypothetical protein
MAASSSHFHIRSHIGTILFLGWTYGFLCDFEEGRGGIGRLFWLVPIYVFWTNVHGGMLGGLGTMGFALAGWCVWRFLGKASPITDYRKALIFVALIVCCGLTIFINPYGLRMPQIWKQIMDGDLPQIILEHAPLDPAKPDGWMVLVFGAVYLTVLAGVWPKWPRVTCLLPLIWFYLACTRIRHAPLFSITAALAIADMLPHTRWAAWIAKSGSDLFQFPALAGTTDRPTGAWRPALLPIGVVVIALLLQVQRISVPVVGHGWARLDTTYWPVELLPQLRAYQNSRQGGTPIFNEYLHGGFLIYQTPGFRVFVDDRCELYGDQWLKDYVHAEEAETAKYLREWERTYPEFDLALTRTSSGFDTYFATSPEWALVQQTEAATLYQRIPPIHREPRASAGVTAPPAR